MTIDEAHYLDYLATECAKKKREAMKKNDKSKEAIADAQLDLVLHLLTVFSVTHS